MIVRACIPLPMVRPAIEDGAVQVSGERIVAVGPWTKLQRQSREEVVDLGNAILLPGLVNAHCHLDYTAMAGQIRPPKYFPDWIKAIVALKTSWTRGDFAASWLKGAEMLLRHGVTTVADVEAMPELLPEMWRQTPLRVISFRELISMRNNVSPADLVRSAASEWSRLPGSEGRVGLSPHAPYTTSAALLDEAARTAQNKGWKLVTHVAESEAEFEMFMYRQGPLYDWLKSQRDMSDCGLGSPVNQLERCGYLDQNVLAVHVNYLARDDAQVLGRYGVHVIHCPRSHEYFRHLVFPRSALAAAGVNICLGTDSLASVRPTPPAVPELSLFAEMQQFASCNQEVAPVDLLKMTTLNPAVALGKEGLIGELSEGAYADLITVPFSGSLAEAADVIVQQGAPSAVMAAGRWIIPPPDRKSAR
jgi:cytosine/adenosine deaminase-related metal-dependent hydrolase